MHSILYETQTPSYICEMLGGKVCFLSHILIDEINTRLLKREKAFVWNVSLKFYK